MPHTSSKSTLPQKDRSSRVKVSRRLNDSEQEHVRYTFLTAGGNLQLDSSEAENNGSSGMTPILNECFYNQSSSLAGAIQTHLESMTSPDEVNLQDSIGISPLHLLCGFNGSPTFIQALELLLARGANVKSADLRGYTPLHYMCYNTLISTEAQLRGLELLIKYGADVNAKEFKVRASPLHLLCNYSTSKRLDEVLTFLIRHRVSLHARTIENRTALHCMCHTNRSRHLLSAVSIMMRHGADANVRDIRNMTALHEVCLFYRNADLGKIVDELLGAKATCINYTAMHKRSALHLIAINYHHSNLPELLQTMIKKHGADPNQSDEKYRTPFHYLLQYNRSPQWTAAVEVMLRNGADVESKDLMIGRTALLHACLNFHQVKQLPQVVALLLENGAQPNVIDKAQRSALHYLTSAMAVDLDVSQCVSSILGRVTSSATVTSFVDTFSVQGTTALCQAARIGCIATLKQLIPLASANVTDAFGKTALDYLKELGERKVKPFCSCCRNKETPQLPSAMLKQLTSKRRAQLKQPNTAAMELKLAQAYLLDTKPYLSCFGEDQLELTVPGRWFDFLEFWKQAIPFQPHEAPRLKNFIRDLTHPCKLPPLVPPRRNKCGWCDVIGTVHNYIKTVTDQAGQIDRRFATESIFSYGSVAESNRLLSPDAHHFAVVMKHWIEDSSQPESVRYNGEDPVDQFVSKYHPPAISSTTLLKYYHTLLETAATWVQRFDIFEHLTSSFDGTITTLYLVYRHRNHQPPLRLTATLSFTVRRSPDVSTMIRSDLPDWCRVAEKGEENEYLTAHPNNDGWKAYYPALERDSIRHAGSTVLHVLQLIKLLVAAATSDDDGLPKRDREPSSFDLKSCLLIYMEMNPPPWNSVDFFQHTLGVMDVLLDKHDFSMTFFDARDKVTFAQMPLFTPISFETKRIILLLKFQLKALLSDKHHSFTI